MTPMTNQQLLERIQKLEKEFDLEKAKSMILFSEIIRVFVPNQEQREAIREDFRKRCQEHSNKFSI